MFQFILMFYSFFLDEKRTKKVKDERQLQLFLPQKPAQYHRKNGSSLRSAKAAALLPRYERCIRLNLLYIILIYKFLSKV